MHIQRILLILTIALSGLVVHAQPEKTPDFESKNVNDATYFISKIIDCRDQIEGSVSIYNRAKYIEPLKKIESNNWLDLISVDFRNESVNGTPVFIKLNWLKLERTLKEILITANIDFYVFRNGTYYYEFNAADYQHLEQNDDVYEQDLKGLANKMIEKSYYGFVHRMDNQLGYQEIVSASDLERNSLSEGAHFNWQIGSEQNGIYYTYDQFRDQIKDTINVFSEHNQQKSSRIPAGAHQFSFNEVQINHVWGVDYNGVTYLKFDGLFYPAFRVNQEIIVHQNEIKKKSNAGKGALIGLVTTVSFGIGLFASSGLILTPVALGLGTGIGAGIGALIPSFSYRTKKYSLDYISGKPLFVGNVVNKAKKADKVEVEEMYAGGKVMFYFPQKAYTPLSISINGGKSIDMPTKSYYEFQADPDDGAVEYCLRTGTGELCDKILPGKLMPEVYEIFLEKDGQISCVKIDDESTMKKYMRWAENGSLTSVNN